MRSRRGLALLLVVGVLGVLALLAVAFVTLSRLERRASQQRVHATRALLLARSGVEDALARVSAFQDADAPASRYLGEDWDASGALDGLETLSEVYGPGRLDRESCPASLSLRPSFFVRDPSSLGADGLKVPLRVQVDGRTWDTGLQADVVSGRSRGFSGAFAATDVRQEYAIRALPQAGLFVNGGDPAAGPDVGYNRALRRVLGILAEALDREDGTDDASPVDEQDGWNLVDLRPAAGWERWPQVRDGALGGSQARLDALRPYLALRAWVDRRVIRPNADPAVANQDWSTWADLKLSRLTYAAPLTRAPDFERIPCVPGGKVVGRAPVPFSWARRRRPVLLALVSGLQGVYLDPKSSQPAFFGDRIGTTKTVGIANTWTPGDEADQAVSAITACTGTFATWQDWNVFCDTLYPTVWASAVTLDRARRALLKANFNPNTDLNKCGPNASFWKELDKSDLLEYSTEFSLVPGLVGHEVSCQGRVVDAAGKVLAVRELSCELAPPSAVRISTQREFVASDLGRLDLAGDEGTPRLPATATPYISLSTGAGDLTWGNALPGVLGNGLSLQAYPEPYVTPGGGAVTISPADFDGSLQLASLETAPEDAYGAGAGPNDMKMLARFTCGLDLDVHDATASTNLSDAGLVATTELANSVLHADKPNTLAPDGCYSEMYRAPAYPDRGNAHGYRSVMSFWFRPNYELADVGVDGSRSRRLVQWTNFRSTTTQYFCIADVVGRYFTAFFEITQSASDVQREHNFATDFRTTVPRRWHLVTFSYDSQAADCHAAGELAIDAGGNGTRGPDLAPLSDYPPVTGNEATAASDLTLDDLGDSVTVMPKPHRIVLGHRMGPRQENAQATAVLGASADGTFDEFALYDFGSGYPDASLGILASNRFKAGRYYKESAYAGLGAPPAANRAGRWYSAPVDLGEARILGLNWTPVVPPGLRAPSDAAPDGRISLELSRLGGNAYALDAGGASIGTRFQDPAMSRVGRTVRTPFRIHAVFQPNLNPLTMQDVPILDPLALDDLTLLHEPASGRRVLFWGEAP